MPITQIMIMLPQMQPQNMLARLTNMRLMPHDMAISTMLIGTINTLLKIPILPSTPATMRMSQKITQTRPTLNRAIIITAIDLHACFLPCANCSAGLFGISSF